MEGKRQEALSILRCLTKEHPGYRPTQDALRKLVGEQL
jgi:hypothetical protein